MTQLSLSLLIMQTFSVLICFARSQSAKVKTERRERNRVSKVWEETVYLTGDIEDGRDTCFSLESRYQVFPCVGRSTKGKGEVGEKIPGFGLNLSVISACCGVRGLAHYLFMLLKRAARKRENGKWRAYSRVLRKSSYFDLTELFKLTFQNHSCMILSRLFELP